MLYQTLAYGGSNAEENKLFSQVIAQSPAITVFDTKITTDVAAGFLQAAGVSTVDDARKLSTEALQAANEKSLQPLPYPVSAYGNRLMK